jgi:hypothetical protein
MHLNIEDFIVLHARIRRPCFGDLQPVRVPIIAFFLKKIHSPL